MVGNDSFGRAVRRARKARGLSQTGLAARVRREDGPSISPQYLKDIEHDRRGPSHGPLVGQVVEILGIGAGRLYDPGNRPPPDFPDADLSVGEAAAWAAFRRTAGRAGRAGGC